MVNFRLIAKMATCELTVFLYFSRKGSNKVQDNWNEGTTLNHIGPSYLRTDIRNQTIIIALD